jgi:hypothetical protein
MSRKTWMIFLSLQSAGIIFSWLSNYTFVSSPFISGIGVGLLVSGNLLLLPGSVIGALVVQKFLFTSGLGTNQPSLPGILIAVTINLAIWLLFAKLNRAA